MTRFFPQHWFFLILPLIRWMDAYGITYIYIKRYHYCNIHSASFSMRHTTYSVDLVGGKQAWPQYGPWPKAAKGTAVPPAEARRCPAPTADHAHTRSQPHLVEDENDLLLYDYWSTLSVVFFVFWRRARHPKSDTGH